jgi:sugar phosphate isomerase/epimerase
MARVREALGELVAVAAEKNVILALENHGGLPCTGEEQVAVIEAVNSPFLRATVDVGNYRGCPQEPVDGTAVASKHCAYVHLKDSLRLPDGGFKSAVLGEGDVDIPGCMRILRDSGYDGFVALEYEAEEDEIPGVEKSVAYMKKIIA